MTYGRKKAAIHTDSRQLSINPSLGWYLSEIRALREYSRMDREGKAPLMMVGCHKKYNAMCDGWSIGFKALINSI